MALRAVVFDFDGLILDTEGVVIEGWRREYERHGVAFDLDAYIETNIGTVRGQDGYVDEYDELERLIGEPVDRDGILARRIEMHDVLLDDLAPNPGVVEWIEGALAAGLRLAIASSSPREWVERLLGARDLDGHFDVVATRTDVGERAKPDPAVYLHALAGLGVEGSEAVALEDSPAGVKAAKRAGMFAVAVPSHYTSGLDFTSGPEAADVVADSLAAYTLPDLLAAFPVRS